MPSADFSNNPYSQYFSTEGFAGIDSLAYAKPDDGRYGTADLRAGLMTSRLDGVLDGLEAAMSRQVLEWASGADRGDKQDKALLESLGFYRNKTGWVHDIQVPGTDAPDLAKDSSTLDPIREALKDVLPPELWATLVGQVEPVAVEIPGEGPIYHLTGPLPEPSSEDFGAAGHGG